MTWLNTCLRCGHSCCWIHSYAAGSVTFLRSLGIPYFDSGSVRVCVCVVYFFICSVFGDCEINLL